MLVIEDLEDLLEIGLRVCFHLLAFERRASFGLAGGIADHGGEIADEENGGVALVLELLELAQHDGVAEVQIRRGGIDAEIDAQRFAGLRGLLELGLEFVFADDFGGAFAQVLELFFNRFELRGSHYFFSGTF